MIVKYKKYYDKICRSTFNKFVGIDKYCCEDLRVEFLGEYSQIDFAGFDFNEEPGIYFMNSDYEQGESSVYKLDYCPFCGEKIELIEIKGGT